MARTEPDPSPPARPDGLEEAAGTGRRPGWLASLAVFACTFAVAGAFSRLGVDPHHDGILLKPALDVASGLVLFRETFTQYGALTTWMQAGALVVFGPQLVVLRLLTAFTYGLVAVLLLRCLLRLLPLSLGLGTVLAWLVTAPYYVAEFHSWSSVYALLFQLAALDRAIDGRFLLAGGAAALSFWCRQPVGLLLLAALLSAQSALFVRGCVSGTELRRSTARILLGFTLASAPLLAAIAWNGALADWWLQSFSFAARFARERAGADPLGGLLRSLFPNTDGGSNVWRLGLLWPLSLWSVLAVASVATLVWRCLDRPSAPVVLLGFGALASWLQYAPVACIRHVYWASPPMYCLLGLLLHSFATRLCGRLRAAAAAPVSLLLLAALVAPDALVRLEGAGERLREHDRALDSPAVLRGLRLTAAEAELHGRIANGINTFLTTHPGRNVVSTGPDALYLTYDTRARNFHPLYVNWGRAVYPDYPERLSAYVAERSPLVLSGRPALVPGGYCPWGSSQAGDPVRLYSPCEARELPIELR